jgi:hypothetical protein
MTDDYEKEFDEKIRMELEAFKNMKHENDHFRRVYDFIIALISMCDQLSARIDAVEKEMKDEKIG